MAIVENTAQKLVLRSGSTTLTLDGDAKQITLQSKLLFWQRAPAHAAFRDVADIKLDEGHDGASGADLYGTMIVLASGKAWALSANSKQEAEADGAAIRKFIGFGKR
jgi:hypothetical protein